jgi:hypothetical protein
VWGAIGDMTVLTRHAPRVNGTLSVAIVKAASSAALNILSLGIFTWYRALRRDALRLLPHGKWHASGDHARRGHDARLFHGSHWRGAWPLLCDGGPHVHGAPPLLYDVLRFVGSYGFCGLRSK